MYHILSHNHSSFVMTRGLAAIFLFESRMIGSCSYCFVLSVVNVRLNCGMSMAWEPDRRSNFFFTPTAHQCAVTYMAEISSTVTFKNQLSPHYRYQRLNHENMDFIFGPIHLYSTNKALSHYTKVDDLATLTLHDLFANNNLVDLCCRWGQVFFQKHSHLLF